MKVLGEVAARARQENFAGGKGEYGGAMVGGGRGLGRGEKRFHYFNEVKQ